MREEPTSATGQPIDVVIAWVDGNDPELTRKRNTFLEAEDSVAPTSVHSTRFASLNEIRYCLFSIFTFAPFVRNVYIVTDGQDPQLWEDLRIHFPERLGSVRVVDHTEIFDGFEQYLPTFNSLSIGSMIWRIRGISPNFVYFNDDVFLIRRIEPTDWFVDDRPVLRGGWSIAPVHQMISRRVDRIHHAIAGSGKKHAPRAYFHSGQWNSAALLGFGIRYFSNSHTPHAVGGRMVGEFFNKNRTMLERNLSFRFRNHSQFSLVAFSNHLQILAGNRCFASPDLVYLRPDKRSSNAIEMTIGLYERDRNRKFFCAQSLDLWHPEDRKKVFEWMDSIIQSGLSDQRG